MNKTKNEKKNEKKKQFIAGARCPKCQAMDKIQLVTESDQGQSKYYYECLACGYHRSDAEFEKTDPDIIPVQVLHPKDTS